MSLREHGAFFGECAYCKNTGFFFVSIAMFNSSFFLRAVRLPLALTGCAIYLGACSSGAPREQASGGQGLATAVPLDTDRKSVV